ncbi:MAG: 50S ribosomal protein L10 [Spirochaetes bacterium GWF1_41_5]|nr:MAG: 50S ribosomal protein L10 [Spirochaetes bacterium GWF1_41_5]HBE01054.1 50S ribosomal protein L10 [Spirochaetia bacterium]
MSVIKQKKIQYIENLSGRIKNANLIFCDYSGISVANVTKLKKNLMTHNAVFKVIKNRLFKRYADSAQIDIREFSVLKGPTAIAVTSDNFSESAKIISGAEDNSLVKIKGAIFENRFLSPADVKKIAKIPSKAHLLAELVGALGSPMSGLVHALRSVLSGFVYTLEAVEDKKK